ncbi:hypothetical protein [Reichenbachiella versicolor]|uniref:hypothetical protein n=1 Tax=Reichenbachiella versicolor TaxID=1821036 RepID=UPI000D6E45B5|nr:hypothetical protein [Reichenbachiella versicolor]
MKKLLLSILAGVLLASCGGGYIDLNDPDSYEEMKELAIDSFGEDLEVYGFSLGSKDHLSSEMRYISVDYIKDGVDYERSYDLINGEGNELEEPEMASKSFQTEFFMRNKQGKLKVKDIDFELINTKYEEAISFLAEQYTDFVLYSWEYEVANDGTITAEFMVEATLIGESTTMSGRNVITNYYQFSFKMNENQELELKED